MDNLPKIRYNAIQTEEVTKRIEQIRERLKKVSPFPWVWHWANGKANINIRDIFSVQGWRRITDTVVYMGIAALEEPLSYAAEHSEAVFGQTKADADFITLAPDDVQFLLSEVDGLRRDLEFVNTSMGTIIDDLRLQNEIAWEFMTDDQKDQVIKRLDEYRAPAD